MNKFLACDSNYEEADIVLFGAPFDGTTSFRPGTRFGPAAIRNESGGLETYSPYSQRDLTDIQVFDAGDLELPFGNPARMLDQVEAAVSQILKDQKKAFMLGGEHLVTLGAVRAALAQYPDLHIIQFDAHTDLRDDYLGESLSHATVIRRCWDHIGDARIHQFGIRSGERHEFDFAEKHNDFHPFNLEAFHDVLPTLFGKTIYLTLDLDVLDPSVFSGTGTPEPGGVSFQELHTALLALSQLNIVACDVNELSPHYDPSGVSTAVACKLVREILLQL